MNKTDFKEWFRVNVICNLCSAYSTLRYKLARFIAQDFIDDMYSLGLEVGEREGTRMSMEIANEMINKIHYEETIYLTHNKPINIAISYENIYNTKIIYSGTIEEYKQSSKQGNIIEIPVIYCNDGIYFQLY